MRDEAATTPRVNSSALLPGTCPGGTLTLTVMSFGGSAGGILFAFGRVV